MHKNAKPDFAIRLHTQALRQFARNLQVIDFIGYFYLAHCMGNLLKGLFFKAFRASRASFQQSYPQIFWIMLKVLINQQLTSCFKKSANLQNLQFHWKYRNTCALALLD